MLSSIFNSLISFFGWIFGAASTTLDWLGNTLISVWQAIWDGLTASLIDLANWAIGLLPEQWQTIFDFSESPTWSFIGDFWVLLPVAYLLQYAVVIYSAAGAIRVVRWIIGFVPTIEG